jgi:hypothetical protein
MLNTIPPITPRTVALLLTLGTTLLGFAIAYIAFRGYRQGSRPMLYIAIGFVLVFGVPFTSFLSVVLVPTAPEYVVDIISETSRFIGLVSILYGLRMPTKQLESG